MRRSESLESLTEKDLSSGIAIDMNDSSNGSFYDYFSGPLVFMLNNSSSKGDYSAVLEMEDDTNVDFDLDSSSSRKYRKSNSRCKIVCSLFAFLALAGTVVTLMGITAHEEKLLEPQGVWFEDETWQESNVTEATSNEELVVIESENENQLHSTIAKVGENGKIEAIDAKHDNVAEASSAPEKKKDSAAVNIKKGSESSEDKKEKQDKKDKEKDNKDSKDDDNSNHDNKVAKDETSNKKQGEGDDSTPNGVWILDEKDAAAEKKHSDVNKPKEENKEEKDKNKEKKKVAIKEDSGTHQDNKESGKHSEADGEAVVDSTSSAEGPAKKHKKGKDDKKHGGKKKKEKSKEVKTGEADRKEDEKTLEGAKADLNGDWVLDESKDEKKKKKNGSGGK